MRKLHARRWALGAAALGSTVLLTVSPAGAVAWNNVAPHIDSGKSVTSLPKLVWSPVAAANTAAVTAAYSSGALSADGGPGLAQVYSHSNRTMYYKTASQCANARSAISAADSAYTLAAWCFDGSEETSNAWVPQSVTSSQDASQYSGYAPGGDEVVAVWRQEAASGNRARCPGVADDSGSSVGLRATFIQRPYTDGTHSAYRHVLLAVPTAPDANGGATFAPVCDVHGGGVAWYGPYLFVAKHGSGVLVFDTRQTYLIPNDTTCGPDHAAPGPNDVGVVTDPSAGGQQLCAGGYRYVMFQVGSFHTTPGGCSTTPATFYVDLCFSSISLQWSDNSLVSSEYRTGADLSASAADERIVNWSTADLIDRITTGSTTPVTATRLAATNFEGVQGVVERPDSANGRPQFFVARTLPGSDGSDLWYEEDGDGVCAARGTFVKNTESISYWVDSSGNGHLWTLTEYANARMLVRVYTNEYNNAPSGCPTQ